MSPGIRRPNLLLMLGDIVGRWRGEVDERYADHGPDVDGRGVQLRRVDRCIVRDAWGARDPCRVGDGATPPSEPPLCVPQAAQLSPLVIVTAVTCRAAATT